MSDFLIEINHDNPNETLATLIGEFQGMTVVNHEEGLMKALSRTKKKLILNMHQVPYLDSSGLGFIMKCARSADQQNKELVILAPSENVLKILKLTKVDKTLTVIA